MYMILCFFLISDILMQRQNAPLFHLMISQTGQKTWYKFLFIYCFYYRFFFSTLITGLWLLFPVQRFNSIQFNFYYSHFYKIFTLLYSKVGNTLRKEKKKEKKKKINDLGRSVRWSEELSFQANHCNESCIIMVALIKALCNKITIENEVL